MQGESFIYSKTEMADQNNTEITHGEPMVQGSDQTNETQSTNGQEDLKLSEQEVKNTVGISSSPTQSEDTSFDEVHKEEAPFPPDSQLGTNTVGSEIKPEDFNLREKSPSSQNKPKIHPLSIDTSDSEASIPRYSPRLYTSGTCTFMYVYTR